MEQKTYLIAGAAGYIGRMLIHNLRGSDKDAHIFALVRDAGKAAAVLPLDVEILVGDVTDKAAMGAIRGEFDYLIHAAAVTQSREMISCPVETADGIVLGTRNVLELARRLTVKSMVYLSSMEVYGKIDCSDGHRVGEGELGDIEISNLRSCYPLGKRMAEYYCFAFAKEYGVPVKIARLAQTFGRGVSAGDNRVFAQFAQAAKDGKDIVLHTEGRSMGNYCAIDDVIDAILLLLEKGENGEAYNIVNEEITMTIREMAELVASEISGEKSRVIIEASEANVHGYAPDTGLRLSAEKMMLLGWRPTKNLKQMYMDMMASL